MADHKKYMEIALKEARRALRNNEFPVGCVIVSNDQIIATGSRKSSAIVTNQQAANELDHAEMVALRELTDTKPETDRSTITLYSTMEPCLMCFSTLILNNIHSIVYGYEDVMGGGTNLPLQRLRPLYRQKKVTIIPNVLRQESIELFKQFFKSPNNKYWQDSLLAQYTLDQPDQPYS